MWKQDFKLLALTDNNQYMLFKGNCGVAAFKFLKLISAPPLPLLELFNPKAIQWVQAE